MINGMLSLTLISSHVKQKGTDGQYRNTSLRERVMGHEATYALIVMTCVLSIRSILSVLREESKNDNEKKIFLNKNVIVLWAFLFEDLPQLILQIITFSQGEQRFFVLFSLVFTCVSILFELTIYLSQSSIFKKLFGQTRFFSQSNKIFPK
eukprot:c18930_g1_i1.p1 GENE.c18930_g1_i1~~c18930_g1_i1.p1  ORF type:complete len:151 (-),score=42.03 c18930_g1_i1:43-495(-)